MRSRTVLMSRNVCFSVTAILGVSALMLCGGAAAFAQAPASAPPAQHAMADADQNKQLLDQIAELRAQVAKLQTAVQQTGPGTKVPAKPGMNMPPAPNKGMGMMDEKSEMGMPAGKGAMPAGSAPMGMKDDQGEMPAPAAAMGMCCMGDKPPAGSAPMSGMPPSGGGMAPMSGPSSAVPGQAGASHLYHIGSNGFFLNHSQHITLTADQKLALNRLKERAMLDRASEQRKIDQGEQELFTLTGADQFDSAKVQTKVSEIEKMRAEQRMNFIRLVGDATNVLTHDQHLALMGTMAASKK